MTPDDPTNIIHGIWASIVSAIGGLAIWNGKRLVQKIDEKVDQSDFDDHRDIVRAEFGDVKGSLNRMSDTLIKHYSQNNERLDKILFELTRK
jgi:HAMP domain-containing protein